MSVDRQLLRALQEELDKVEQGTRRESERLNSRLSMIIHKLSKRLNAVLSNALNGGTFPMAKSGEQEKQLSSSAMECIRQVLDETSNDRYYGSIELREAIKQARKKMYASVDALKQTSDFIRSRFVKEEIQKLLSNVDTLDHVFKTLESKMESLSYLDQQLESMPSSPTQTN